MMLDNGPEQIQVEFLMRSHGIRRVVSRSERWQGSAQGPRAEKTGDNGNDSLEKTKSVSKQDQDFHRGEAEKQGSVAEPDEQV